MQNRRGNQSHLESNSVLDLSLLVSTDAMYVTEESCDANVDEWKFSGIILDWVNGFELGFSTLGLLKT